MTEPLLDIRNVGKSFGSGPTTITAVKSMSLTFPSERATVISLAGESGCGKSTLALMALGFLHPTSGRIVYKGRDIASLDTAGFRQFRKEVQAVFQDPFEVFNPAYRVVRALTLAVKLIGLPPRSEEARNLVRKALMQVGLDPDQVLGRFPHQLSGGQLQRIAIARTILIKPRILIADEPVSMVDASLRLLILKQLLALKDELQVSILYITHDLSTALQISDELLIACQGTIVERGDPVTVFKERRHEYTKLLISSIPQPDPDARWTSEVAASVDA